MAHDHAIKTEIRRLYVFDQLPLERAAEQVGVSESTARRWKKQSAKKGDDWDKIRTAHTLAGNDLEDIARQLLTNLVLEFKATMDALKADEKITAENRVKLLTSLSDSYNKAISANQKLLPEVTSLAIALRVLKRFAEYINQRNPDLLVEFTNVIDDFGVLLEKEFK